MIKLFLQPRDTQEISARNRFWCSVVEEYARKNLSAKGLRAGRQARMTAEDILMEYQERELPLKNRHLSRSDCRDSQSPDTSQSESLCSRTTADTVEAQYPETPSDGFLEDELSDFGQVGVILDHSNFEVSVGSPITQDFSLHSEVSKPFQRNVHGASASVNQDAPLTDRDA